MNLFLLCLTFSEWTSLLTAIFTGAAATIYYFQARTMGKALRESHRSADAFVAAERGRLYIDHMRMTTDRTRFDFDVKNIGSGPLIISFFKPYARLFAVGEADPKPFPQREMIIAGYPLGTGEYFSTWEHHGIPMARFADFGNTIDADDAQKLINKTHRLCIQFDFGYETLGTNYRFRDTRCIRFDDIEEVYPLFGDERRFDRIREKENTPSQENVSRIPPVTPTEPAAE